LGWTHASKYLLRSVFRETADVGRESGVGIIRLAAKEADPSHMLRRFYGISSAAVAKIRGRRDLIAKSANHLTRHNTSLVSEGAATGCNEFAGINEPFISSSTSL
jgi:hypothetical protein